MSVIGGICDKFNLYYKEIDSQIDLTRASQQSLCESLLESDCELKEKSSCMTIKDIDSLIDIAKEFESELTLYVKENKLKGKQVKKTEKVTSSFPLIWNDEHLTEYITGVLDELLEDPEEPATKKTVIKNPIKIVKPDTPISSQIFKPKRVHKEIKPKKFPEASKCRPLLQRPKTVDFSKLHPQYKLENSNDTLFPRRVAQTAPIIPTIQEPVEIPAKIAKPHQKVQPKASRAPSKAPKNFKKGTSVTKTLKVPSKPSESLKISPTTVTSLNPQKSQNSQKLPKETQPAIWRQTNVEQTNSSIATPARCIKPTRNATKYSVHHQAALSIKGECSIEKVLHFEILPQDAPHLPAKATNSKYAEFFYNDATTDSHANKSLSVAGAEEFNGANKDSTASDRNCNRRHDNDDNEVQEVERNVIIDDGGAQSFYCRDLQRLLNQQLLINDGEVKISIQGAKMKRKTKKLSKFLMMQTKVGINWGR